MPEQVNPTPTTFDAIAREVLSFLHTRLGLDLWMVTRTQGDDWIVLQIEDHEYGIAPKSVFPWAESFCSRMVAGLGPRIAPSSKDVPAYADAPIGQRFTIGAYIGVPLHYADGSLFGTLCAIHPSPRPEIIAEELPMIELLAGMLSALLNAELAAADADRRAERARDEAESDALTGLLNRRAWDRLLAAEEARCRRYGNPACVAVVDLDGLKATNDAEGHAAGDRLICQAAQALRGAVRERDIVARIGGDEFALLGVECDPARAHHLEERLKAALAEAGVQASVGIAPLVLASGLQHAWHEADQRMYRAKAVRNSGLVS